MSRVRLENQENVPVLQKYQESRNTSRKLPPNVFGNSRGFLDLYFDKIQWNVTPYANLSARIVWWGENCDESDVIRIPSGAAHPHRLNYSVCTNATLFRKYLTSCEAIEVQFSSKAAAQGNSRRVGTAFISIPEELLAQDIDYFSPRTCTSTHKIFSAKNTTLGVLKVTMKLVLFEDLTKSDPLSERNEWSRMAPVKDYSTPCRAKDPYIRCDSVASSSKVWSFLRGKEMSARDAASTMRDILESSTANSVIEAMDEEVTWKLRDIYSRRSRVESGRVKECHNPGESDEGSTMGNGEKKVENTERSSGSSHGKNGSKDEDQGNDKSGEKKADDKKNGGKEGEIKEKNEQLNDYQGIFYVGGFRNQHPHNRVPNVFVLAKSISTVETSLMKTHLSDRNLFVNYLRVFPMKIDDSLETNMRQATLTVELWTRSQGEGGHDVKMGTASLGLHPFYVAFHQDVVRNRLFDLSMPVIAVDGWVMVQGADGASIGQLEVVLAMGTKQQVEYFIQSKQLLNRRSEPETPPVSTRSTETATSILSSFLDNLSQQMAANKQRQAQENDSRPAKKGELRKTSDLLDILNKSLSAPPPAAAAVANDLFGKPRTITDTGDKTDGVASRPDGKDEEFVKVSLEIESAMHLPRVGGGASGRQSSGAMSRKAKKKNKKVGGGTGTGDNEQDGEVEQEPSAYATFEARITDGNLSELVDSVEGKVFATRVVEQSSNPNWNQKFEVEIPKDLLTHPQKYFIIKIWRKRENSPDLKPLPLQDVVVGFCTVDLKVLTAGLPEIAGCYNIVYFDGTCNGQLQIKLQPLEEIVHRDVLDRGSAGAMSSVTVPMCLDLSMGHDVSLSRTLKRKFTELDEITERLRARLHNVTSSELVSSDDEFENDLNTSVDEVDDEELVVEEGGSGDVVDAVKDDFNWLGNLTEMQRQFVEIDRQLQRNSQTLSELLDRNGSGGAVPGPSGVGGSNLYTNNGGVGEGTGGNSAVDSLETALKDAMLNDRPK